MSEAKAGADAKAAFGLALGLAVIGALIDSGAIGWLLAPIVLMLSWFAMSRAPLRSSLLVLTFFAFALENPSEMPAAGAWESPFFSLGALMLQHLNRATGVGALFFSGMDVMLASLGVIAFMRRSTGRRDAVSTPKPMLKLAYVSLVGTVYVWLNGKIHGGDGGIALWQIDRVIYLPLVFLLFQAALRGPDDYAALAKVVLGAACLRACQAMYVQSVIDLPPDPWTGPVLLPYATSHHDSMLFAWAAAILAAIFIQRAVKRPMRLVLLVGPILLAGMYANQRRMVWVQLLIVLFAMYVITPPNAIKRHLARLLKIAAPFALAYVVIGWGSYGGIFKPVQVIRSAVVSDVNASTQWRDVENVDLIHTIRTFPILGTGYGHGFIELIPLPEVDYVLERFIPHNSILGLWAYCGYFGFTAMTLLWVAGVYFAVRGFHASEVPREKAAALASFAAILIYWVQCYGDMGLGSWTGVFMIAPALAAAGKLAVAAGAWTGAPAARRAAAAGPAVRASNPPRPSVHATP